MKKRTYKKYIKLFVPKLAFDNFHYKLSLLSPDFEYDIDIFYSILNDLGNITYFNSYEAKNGMIPMYSKFLKMKYGNSYNKYIKYLHVHSIICRSGNYTIDNCYHYGLVLNRSIENLLNREYINNTYCVQIYKTKTIQLIDFNGVIANQKRVKNAQVVEVKVLISNPVGKKIIGLHNNEADRLKHYPEHVKKMGNHFKKTLAIAYDDATDHALKLLKSDTVAAKDDSKLIETAYNKFHFRIRSIIGISLGTKDKGLRFTRTKTNGRIDTNLTNLSKDLRPFLIGYQDLSYLDLCNSQPVLFNVLLNKVYDKGKPELKAEIDLYREHTLNGTWYELLMDIYNVDRDAAKTLWMKIAYSKNIHSKKYKKPFKTHFPEIMTMIEEKKEKNHASFAIELQKIESKIFIDEICKALVDRGIIPYTIHDGLLVPKEKESETYDVMVSILENHLGAVPVISVNDKKIKQPDSSSHKLYPKVD